jgi:hypothetical protein
MTPNDGGVSFRSSGLEPLIVTEYLSFVTIFQLSLTYFWASLVVTTTDPEKVQHFFSYNSQAKFLTKNKGKYGRTLLSSFEIDNIWVHCYLLLKHTTVYFCNRWLSIMILSGKENSADITIVKNTHVYSYVYIIQCKHRNWNVHTEYNLLLHIHVYMWTKLQKSIHIIHLFGCNYTCCNNRLPATLECTANSNKVLQMTLDKYTVYFVHCLIVQRVMATQRGVILYKFHQNSIKLGRLQFSFPWFHSFVVYFDVIKHSGYPWTRKQQEF